MHDYAVSFSHGRRHVQAGLLEENSWRAWFEKRRCRRGWGKTPTESRTEKLVVACAILFAFAQASTQNVYLINELGPTISRRTASCAPVCRLTRFVRPFFTRPSLTGWPVAPAIEVLRIPIPLEMVMTFYLAVSGQTVCGRFHVQIRSARTLFAQRSAYEPGAILGPTIGILSMSRIKTMVQTKYGCVRLVPLLCETHR